MVSNGFNAKQIERFKHIYQFQAFELDGDTYLSGQAVRNITTGADVVVQTLPIRKKWQDLYLNCTYDADSLTNNPNLNRQVILRDYNSLRFFGNQSIEDAKEVEVHVSTGWHLEQWNFQPETSDFANGIRRYYAQYERNRYTLSFDAGEGSVYPNEKEIIYGKAYGELPIPVREDYRFEGWMMASPSNARPIKETDLLEDAEDKTAYAEWVSILDDNNGTTSKPEQGEDEHETDTVPNPPHKPPNILPNILPHIEVPVFRDERNNHEIWTEDMLPEQQVEALLFAVHETLYASEVEDNSSIEREPEMVSEIPSTVITDDEISTSVNKASDTIWSRFKQLFKRPLIRFCASSSAFLLFVMFILFLFRKKRERKEDA